MTTVNDLLSETEKILNSFGWRRGAFGNNVKGRDLVGALSVAAGKINANATRLDELVSLSDVFARIRAVVGDDNLVHWNDKTAKSLADVTRVLREART